MADHFGSMSGTLPSPSASSFRSIRPVPLLTLAQPALALGEDLALGEPGQDNNVGEIWNVITRAADLVKDGERLENLAWRHWGQPRRACFEARRLSMSSNGSGSTSSLHTLHTPTEPSPFLRHSRSFEKRTFGGALKLLLEKDENNFKDWVEEAKKHYIPPSHSSPVLPTISVPDTPVANVEIRLVEPTPVPSRVGSLGGSMGASGMLAAAAAVPPALREHADEEEEEELASEHERTTKFASSATVISPQRVRSPKKKGKFFVQSSPTKGSGSDTSHPSHTSPVAPTAEKALTTPPRPPKHDRRRSSGDSSTGLPALIKADTNQLPHSQPLPQRRHISLSTMRGKYHAEKRRAAEEHQKLRAKINEESGWEDEDENEAEEDWSDDEGEAKVGKGKGKGKEQEKVPMSPEPQEKRHPPPPIRRTSSSSKGQSARPKSHTQLDLGALLTRKPSRSDANYGTPPHNSAPPPPAPTPLRKMSKRERNIAAAERAKIEADLEAQRQREMFAKQQIFGDKRPAAHTGLLANALRSGTSMQSAMETSIRPSPTHTQLSSLAFSPAPGPTLLRSKSAVAMPVQTGVSITVPPHAIHDAVNAKGKAKAQSSSQERAKEQVELESEDEDSDEDADYLNTTSTRQKLEEMAAKRDAKIQAAVAPTLPQPLPSGQRVNQYGVVQPMTPTTRRRTIIVSEMSESLRKNVVLEREKSAGHGSRTKAAYSQAQPASSGSSQRLPSRSSADNLYQSQGGQALERRNSQPTRLGHSGGYMPPIYSESNSPVSNTVEVGPSLGPPVAAAAAAAAAPSPEPHRRRPQPTLLGGANYLRPLTRASTGPAQVAVDLTPTPTLSRAQSSAAIAEISPASVSPRIPEAPPMIRRATDHEGLQMLTDREARRRELVKRRETTDTSYRLHGW